MAKFLLPFDAGRHSLSRISPTSLLLTSVFLAIIISIQTDYLLVLFLLLFIVIGGTAFRTRWEDVIPLVARFELVILFWILLEPFLYGTTVIFSIELPWGTLHAYREGLLLGLLLGTRMLTLITLFTVTLSHLSLTEFIGALRTLRVPEAILGSLMIMLRYIPLFIEERELMHDAQVLRGYEKGERLEKVKSVGYLVGTTIDRAFDRSASVYESMSLRGFGKGSVILGAGFKKSDAILVPLLAMAILAIHFVLPVLVSFSIEVLGI